MKHTYYTANFDYLGQSLTISAHVFDKWEEMTDLDKRIEAADIMTDMLRQRGIYTKRCIHSREVYQVKREESVPWIDTVHQIEAAEKAFPELPADKRLIIGLAHAHGVM